MPGHKKFLFRRELVAAQLNGHLKAVGVKVVEVLHAWTENKKTKKNLWNLWLTVLTFPLQRSVSPPSLLLVLQRPLVAPSDISFLMKWIMFTSSNSLPAMLDHCAPLMVPLWLLARDDPHRAFSLDIVSWAFAYVPARSLNTYGIKKTWVLFFSSLTSSQVRR